MRKNYSFFGFYSVEIYHNRAVVKLVRVDFGKLPVEFIERNIRPFKVGHFYYFVGQKVERRRIVSVARARGAEGYILF